MSAWTRLLAASSLAIGTAWDLITHPRTGGAGTVVCNGMAVQIDTAPMQVSLAEPIDVQIDTIPMIAVLDTNGISAQINPPQQVTIS